MSNFRARAAHYVTAVPFLRYCESYCARSSIRLPDGTLHSRKFEDALIRDPEGAVAQALRIVEEGRVIASDGSEVASTPKRFAAR